MDLLLAEQLLLLVLDDESGASKSPYDTAPGLAGGLLLDLADREAVREEGGRLVAAPSPVGGPALLTDAQAAIAASPQARDAKGWVKALPTELKPLRRRVADGLVERGVLEERRHKLLGLFPRTSYPEVDGAVEADLRTRLNAVLTAEREPTRQEAMLIALLVPYGQIGRLVAKSERKAAKERAQAIAEDGIAGRAVKSAIRDIQAGVIAATTAATVAATSGAVAGSS